MRSLHVIAALVLPSLLLGSLGGCAVNPATGGQTFTGGLSTSQEIKIGRQEHPKILKQFGGEYGSPELQRYVQSIGQLLAQTVERKDIQYKFTLLNSPIVNAFAVPGGYIYITRGLMTLADNEAQLAGVLAHELGHLTALHHARRYGQGMLANILLGGIAIAGGGSLAQAGQLGAVAVLQSYSRANEFEADDLGIRYMSRAGYDPQELAGFLGKLRANSRLTAKLMGRSPDQVDQFDFMATHPTPVERVRRASANARAVSVRQAMRAQDVYFRRINGMLYGDDPEQGFIRGNVFSHPVLRFTFTVPDGFRLFNSSSSVAAMGPNGARIIFDRAPKPTGGAMTAYLRDVWAAKLPLNGVERIDVNGLEAATGAAQVQTRQGPFDLRLVAIRQSRNVIYRFMFLTPPNLTNQLSLPLRRTTYSFRRLSQRQARALKPRRLRTVRVRRGDTVQRLARRMAFKDLQVQRFRVLNGLEPGQGLRAGQMVKIVTE